jgi:hypothetical protein
LSVPSGGCSSVQNKHKAKTRSQGASLGIGSSGVKHHNHKHNPIVFYGIHVSFILFVKLLYNDIILYRIHAMNGIQTNNFSGDRH